VNARLTAPQLDLSANGRMVRIWEEEALMSEQPKTCGFNHVATMTADLDRYLEFYGDIFGAQVLTIMEGPGRSPSDGRCRHGW